MEEFRCYLQKVLFGNGKLKVLGDCVQEWGNKAFLAIDPYLDKIGVSDEVITLFKKSSIETIKYTDIEPNPDCFGVDRAAEIAEQEACKVVVTVGGGSTMDFSKGIAIEVTNPGRCGDYTERTDHTVLRPDEKTLPVIAVPTTAGTGSEVTCGDFGLKEEDIEKVTHVALTG